MITADLKGKSALVTGGASGIGLATVELFARCGARVAMNHRPENKRAQAEIDRLKSAGHDIISAPGDISQPGEAEAMVAAAVDRLGGLDVLVNNAATPGAPSKGKRIDYRDLDVLTEEWWQGVLSTNLVGAFRCTRAAAPALKKARGAVVSTASIAGLGTVGSNLIYGTSKAALIHLTRYLSKALAPEVRVNAVAPGLVETPWTEDWPAELKQGAAARTPLKRNCTPEDIAETILFFAAGAAMVTGQVLAVDGGLL